MSDTKKFTAVSNCERKRYHIKVSIIYVKIRTWNMYIRQHGFKADRKVILCPENGARMKRIISNGRYFPDSNKSRHITLKRVINKEICYVKCVTYCADLSKVCDRKKWKKIKLSIGKKLNKKISRWFKW